MVTTDFPCIREDGFTTYGGAGACMGQLVEGLLANGLEVTVITRREGGRYSEKYDTRIIRTDYMHFGSLARDSKITHSYYAARELRRLLKTECFDMIHSHNPPAALAAIKGIGEKDIPHLLTMHGPWAGVRLNPIKRVIARRIEGYAVRNATHVTCDAPALLDEMIKKYKTPKDKLTYIPNAVDTGFFRPELMAREEARNRLGVETDDKIVLYTGRFLREKGVDVLLDSVPKVLKKSPKTLFLLVGGGYDEKLVSGWVEKNGKFKDKVKVIPYLPYNSMPAAYIASDVLVQPSLAEGLSRSVMEAMACGLPIVASKVGGNPELVNDATGVLAKAGSSRQTAKAIVSLLGKNHRQMGLNARKQMLEKYSVKRRVDSFIKLYEKLIA